MPAPGFLAGLRELTRQHDILLILDEVVTGFRYGLAGAQGHFGVKPDLATYGKIIGSGLPVGAVAGRADVMDQANPGNKGKPGYVYQNGTLQGHCLGSAAGLAALDTLAEPGVYERVFRLAEDLRTGVRKVLDRHAMGAIVFGHGPMWHVLFTDREPQTYSDVLAADNARLMRLERELIRNGLFVLPGNRRFVSITHTEQDLEDAFAAFDRACRALRQS
jgi:glutamate-1-semialdehyde 2,1-aminomutase